MMEKSKSDSREQQNAECYIATEAENMLGCKFEHNAKVVIGEGVHIEPDLYSETEKIVCEIYAHIGNLKVGQQHKVSQDILKMLLLDKCKGVRYRKVIFVADDKVKRYLLGKSFIAESIRWFDIEVIKIELPSEIYESVSKAQIRQIMKNA